MRISDWSSDVCSSDLSHRLQYDHAGEKLLGRAHDMNLCRTQLAYSGTYYHLEHELPQFIYDNLPKAWLNHHFAPDHMQYSARIRSKPNQIGRASCRERVCQYV